MKRTSAKKRAVKPGAASRRVVHRPSRVQRGRDAVAASVTVASSFTHRETAYPGTPWDGRRLGASLVDTSQLACECGACWGCQQRVG